MGTEIELLVRPRTTGAARTLDAAEAEFHRLEALLSRFREDSELSRLNRDGSLEAGPDLVRVLELALAARERTEGRFDPTIHNALVAAGYDRSFELLEPESGIGPRPAESAAGRVRTDGARIELEPGVRVDLGGIAKGYAAERAAELLALAGPCLVNAGGDVAIRNGRWPVGVETADGSLTLELSNGGLATSGRDRRHWRRGGVERHHLIDPTTGAPAETDLLRVTAIAADAVEAEVAAKTLFLAGSDRAAAENVTAVLVTDDGRTLFTGALGA
jgi:thiamine biosynthesis lipoprotein